MKPQNWIDLAVANKKASNVAMRDSYRDIDALVATDGSRLHILDDQPKLIAPLKNTSYEFPPYRQVLTFTNYNRVNLSMSSDGYKSLKHFLKYAAVASKFIDVEFVGNNLLLSFDYQTDKETHKGTHVILNCFDAFTTYNSFFDASFLLDALMMFETPLNRNNTFSIRYKDDNNGLALTMDDMTALVMPTHKEKCRDHK